MPTIDFTIPHQLTQDEAQTRIKNLLSEAAREHQNTIKNLKESWTGNQGHFTFSAMGYDIEGTLIINSANVQLSAKVPFAVSLFKGTITKMIEEKAGQLLK